MACRGEGLSGDARECVSLSPADATLLRLRATNRSAGTDSCARPCRRVSGSLASVQLCIHRDRGIWSARGPPLDARLVVSS